MFLEVGEKHEELDKVLKQLEKIKFKGDKVSFTEPVDPAKFLPKDSKALYTYEGSLTTPPLLESVIWTVFKEPIQISKEQVGMYTHQISIICFSFFNLKIVTSFQLAAMRGMKCGCKEDKDLAMVDNYRPPCPLGNRTLRQS